jgi:large subunit ribosomal protein L10
LDSKTKKAIVAEVNETANSALSLVIADARGVTVDGMTALRESARVKSEKISREIIQNVESQW